MLHLFKRTSYSIIYFHTTRIHKNFNVTINVIPRFSKFHEILLVSLVGLINPLPTNSPINVNIETRSSHTIKLEIFIFN
ncbi:hypothetical protein HanPI659440_Chr16g0637121 [Helianthus annuus]|nr:hypothetical protein HanPI659440_Chr16g0637121 [Helianthus annuus]